ncbi:MAG TPA: hypothetical protein VN345_14775 [Blastocatellia bacterium]|nr:hypothetical protein [Blastocatellia bacterium]
MLVSFLCASFLVRFSTDRNVSAQDGTGDIGYSESETYTDDSGNPLYVDPNDQAAVDSFLSPKTCYDYSTCSSGGNQGFIDPNGLPPSSPCCQTSPILVDVTGHGFDLTDAAHGVLFDITVSGTGR